MQLPVSEAQFHALLDHLDRWLGDNRCDRTLAETLSWADRTGLNANQLKALLPELGGGCDCEVLANLDPDDWLGSEPARFTFSSATDAGR